MSFHAFGQCFRLILDITLQNPENMLKNYSKLSITENRIEKLLLVHFLLPLWQMIEKILVLLGHIAISQPIHNV